MIWGKIKKFKKSFIIKSVPSDSDWFSTTTICKKSKSCNNEEVTAYFWKVRMSNESAYGEEQILYHSYIW